MWSNLPKHITPVAPSLQLLGYSQHVNKEWNRRFLLTTEDGVMGGFAKHPDSYPGMYVTCHAAGVVGL